MIRTYFNGLKTFKFGIFFALCFVGLFPAIYQTLRTFFLSTTVSVDQFDIIGQMEWYDLINEIILAFLIIPLYSIFNKIYKNSGDIFPKVIFKTLIISVVLYTVFSVCVYFYGEHLIRIMNVVPENIEITRIYLQLETLAFIAMIVSNFANVVFVIINKKSYIYILLGLRVVLTIIGDYLLIPHYGVNGVAYSNILINSIISIVSLVILIMSKNIMVSKFNKEDRSIWKLYLKEGIFSGLQSFLDNLIYIVMVAKMVNMVANQGSYWLANNFIWLWLLIPIVALTEVIKSDCKDGYSNLKQSNYFTIIIVVVLIWICTIPTWELFFRYVEKIDNYSEVFDICIKLFWFYIPYALCIIPDSIFIGLGKNKYNFINSLIINLGYYGLFYLFYSFGYITMTIDVIILMFGFGMVTHMVVSYIEEKIMSRIELRRTISE